jgi:transposase-like protein
LSYRDLVAMMAERGIAVSHTTIHRWLIRYVPEFEKRWNRFARPVNNSWRVDETYIKVQGKWNYLYRAVDKHGKTVDFLLRPDRGIAAAQAFFRKAFTAVAAQDHARRPRAEPPGPSVSAAGRSDVEVRSREK